MVNTGDKGSGSWWYITAIIYGHNIIKSHRQIKLCCFEALKQEFLSELKVTVAPGKRSKE